MNDSATRLAALGRWPADVEVWQVRVSTDLDVMLQQQSFLDAAELQRANAFRRTEDRARFMTARYALRVLLGARVCVAPQTLRFASTGNGKPTLECQPDLSFNVSHSGAFALIALSAERLVGVDIERADAAFNWQTIADLVCTDDERREIEHLPTWEQALPFLRCWTAKEALLKAVGIGIGTELRAVTVKPFAEGVQRPKATPGSAAADAAALSFHWLHETNEYVACVAYGDEGSSASAS
jgi:4'-phosphopantetheinyl transferase